MSSGKSGSRGNLTIVKEKKRYFLYRFGCVIASADSEEKLRGILGYSKNYPFRNSFEYEENTI